MTTREKILAAADGLFGEIGFDAATTRQIADNSGVNKALIHYHFGSKDELFQALLDQYYEKLTETLAGVLTDEGSVQERFDRLIDIYVDFLAENRNFSRMIQREASGGRHVDGIVNHMLPLLQVGIDVLRREYPESFGDELEAAQMLISFYGMVVSYFTYSPVLEQLLGIAPLAKPSLEKRKRHLKRIFSLIVDAFDQ